MEENGCGMGQRWKNCQAFDDVESGYDEVSDYVDVVNDCDGEVSGYDGVENECGFGDAENDYETQLKKRHDTIPAATITLAILAWLCVLLFLKTISKGKQQRR